MPTCRLDRRSVCMETKFYPQLVSNKRCRWSKFTCGCGYFWKQTNTDMVVKVQALSHNVRFVDSTTYEDNIRLRRISFRRVEDDHSRYTKGG